MQWENLIALVFRIVGKPVEELIGASMLKAAEIASIPGSVGSPQYEISMLFDLAIDATAGRQVELIVLRAAKRICVPRSAAIWNGEAGDDLTESEKESIGLVPALQPTEQKQRSRRR